jgi:signal peptidase II
MPATMSRAALRGSYFGIAALVFAADRLSKVIVREHIALNYGNVPVVPHFFSLTHVENTGAAFSILADWPPSVRLPLLVSFSVIALAVISYLLWNSARRFTWNGLALSLILGGALGNLYERVLYGRVTDFLHCYIGTHSWPDFNVADSAIVIGTSLLVLELVIGGKAAHEG